MSYTLAQLNTCRESYITCRESARKAFMWSGSSYTFPVCGAVLAVKRPSITHGELKACRSRIKERTGVFSNFRGVVMEPMACILAASDAPDSLLTRTLAAYEALKRHFKLADEYVALSAMTMAQMSSMQEFTAAAAKTRAIYDLMKANHPIVTSREDVPFAAMLALSAMTAEETSRQAEEIFRQLKGSFVAANAAQALSHVLALGEGDVQTKCSRVVDLYDALRLRGYRYYRDYNMSTLAAVSLLPIPVSELADSIANTADWLKGKKGYGIMGHCKKERLMHAAMLVSTSCGSEDGTADISVGSTVAAAVAMIAAQQAAICAAIVAANVAASNAASSDSN